MTRVARPPAADPRHVPAVTELLQSFFRRDVVAFLPHAHFEALPVENRPGGAAFQLREGAGLSLEVELLAARYRISGRNGAVLSPQDRRMVRAIGAVLSTRFHHLFQISSPPRLELYRGGSEDHYVAAVLEPAAYEPWAARPSRIAATIQALRTAALSTYENQRVSTGALLMGPHDDPTHDLATTAPDALPYSVELTGLKSVHRLCDGKRTLFLVDRAGRLAEIIDITRWAAQGSPSDGPEIPCARAFASHARATSTGGHICLVLSPNQEIKLFAGGTQGFAFSHGRWRMLDPHQRFAVWGAAVANPSLSRMFFQAALDLAEVRQGGLFVVVSDPAEAVGTLIAPHDLLSSSVASAPPSELSPRDPLAKRALHYLARGRNVTDLDPSVIEALASLDGALVTDRTGRLLAFGAILRHEISDLPALATAEGARTTAAHAASRFGPVLKVSEDGLVSCFLNGQRAWDL